MPRTTLAIEADLLRRLKERAAQTGTTLQALTNDLLRQSLAAPEQQNFHLELEGWDATQLAGVDLFDRDKLFELMNGR